MNLDQVLYDLFALSSGESCKRLYLSREAQGGPSDGPGKPREGPRVGLWEAQEESRQDPGRPREVNTFISVPPALSPLKRFFKNFSIFFQSVKQNHVSK